MPEDKNRSWKLYIPRVEEYFNFHSAFHIAAEALDKAIWKTRSLSLTCSHLGQSHVLRQSSKCQLFPRILFVRRPHYVAAIVAQLHYAICITLFEGRYTRFTKHRLTKLPGIYNWYINLLLSEIRLTGGQKDGAIRKQATECIARKILVTVGIRGRIAPVPKRRYSRVFPMQKHTVNRTRTGVL